MPKLPVPSWLTLPEALVWLTERGIPEDDAKTHLPRAIRDGHIRSRGRSKKFTGHTTKKLLHEVAWQGAAIDWKGNWFAIPDDRGYAIDFDLVDVSTDDISRWIGLDDKQQHVEAESEVSVPQQIARIRAPKYDWDTFFAEIAVRADLDGLPGTQADLERDMAGWCLEHWGEQPSESTIRSKVSGIYRHPRRRQADEF